VRKFIRTIVGIVSVDDVRGRMDLDIHCLRSFALVAETMSFSRAAEAVRRSQSTVSQQINKLETQVGRRLLVRRKGRVVQLTADGRKLLEYAARMLQLNDEAYSSMSDNSLSGFIRLGVPLDFFGRNFTNWLAQFKSLHPMVGLDVEANQSEHLFKRTRRGEFDLAFFKQDTGAGHGNTVVRERLVWVARENFTPPTGQSLPLILFPDGCAYRRAALSTLRSAGLASHISFVSPSFECLRTAVVEGHGITVLARALVAAPMRVIGQRARLPPLPVVEIAYMYGRDDKSQVVTELAHFLADSLTNAGPPTLAKAA
jgi:DNA-binding transcriptional LysR family regulator